MALPDDGYITSVSRTTGEYRTALDSFVTEVAKGTPDYVATRTYNIGYEVKASNGYIYRSAVNSNIGNNPVADALGSNWVLDNRNNIVFGSVTEMVSATWLQIGCRATTLGYYSEGDGGGNIYGIVAAATGIDDGGSFIDLSGSGLQAKGIFSNGKICVKQFGAKGDGINDDILPISAAVLYLQSVGGGELYYPAGVYLVSRAIRLDWFNYFTDDYVSDVIPLSKISHRGDGLESTTIRSTSYNSIFTSFPEPYLTVLDLPTGVIGTDIVIEGMTLDCDYNNVPDYGSATYSNASHYYEVSKLGGTWKNGSATPAVATWASDNYQYPVYTRDNERITIKECLIKNSWYNGIEVYTSNDIRIERCILLNCGNKVNVFGLYSAVEFDNSSRNLWLVDSHVEDCGTGVMSNGDPLPYATSPVSNVTVRGNTFVNLNAVAMYIFSWTQDWHITGNTLKNLSGDGIFVFEDNRAGKVANRHPDRFVISNNVIKGFNSSNQDATAIRFEGLRAVIDGNIIIDDNPATTANTRAILVGDNNIDVGTFETISHVISNNVVSGRFPSDSNTGVVQIASPNANVSGNKIGLVDSAAHAPFVTYGVGTRFDSNNIDGAFGHDVAYKFVGVNGVFSDPKYNPFFEAETTITQPNLAAGWQTVDWDSWGSVIKDVTVDYNTTTNAFITPYDGYYQFNITGKFENIGAADTPNIIIVAIEVNGTSVEDSSSIALEGANSSLQLNTVVNLSAGSSVTTRVYSDDTQWNFALDSRITIEFIGQKGV